MVSAGHQALRLPDQPPWEGGGAGGEAAEAGRESDSFLAQGPSPSHNLSQSLAWKARLKRTAFHSFLASPEACWASPWSPAAAPLPPPRATGSRVPAKALLFT